MDPEYQKITIVVEDSKEVATYVFYKTAGFQSEVTYEEPERYYFGPDLMVKRPDRIDTFNFSFRPIANKSGEYCVVTKKPRPS
jgi:hypothetical protein